MNKELSLQKFSLDRAEELFDLVNKNRAYLRKALPWLDKNTELNHIRNFINETLEKNKKGESGSAYFIILKDSIIGVIDAYHIDKEKNLFQIGYWLAENYQGQGIITSVCEKLIKEMFDKGFSLAEIRCAVNNPKSCAVAERLGFIEVGVLSKESNMYGELIDMRIWQLKS